MAKTNIDLERAIEVFMKGYGAARSSTHPLEIKKVGAAWMMRDAPRKSGAYRREEWAAHGIAPEKLDRTVRAQTRGRFIVCDFIAEGDEDVPVREAYKALDYRFRGPEPLMVHPLARIPRPKTSATIERVRSAEAVGEWARAARHRMMLPPRPKTDAPFRQYVARVDGEIVGGVTSIQVGDSAWVQCLSVLVDHRRKGIGRALMCRMLRDDRASGVKQSVLVASSLGATLYPQIGYRRLGTLLAFTPKKN